jgi:hypothetical protein
MIGIIAILIASGNLIYPLSQQLEQRMVCVSCGPRVIDLGRRRIEDVEALIYFSHQEKARIGRNLRALKINADGSVETRPYGPCLFVTNCAHAAFPPFDEFQPQY